jgi:hypothetical protein
MTSSGLEPAILWLVAIKDIPPRFEETRRFVVMLSRNSYWFLDRIKLGRHDSILFIEHQF